MHYHADCYGELVFHSAVEQYCRFYRATLCYIVVSAVDVGLLRAEVEFKRPNRSQSNQHNATSLHSKPAHLLFNRLCRGPGADPGGD